MGLLDITLVCGYLLVITYFGLFVARPARTIEQYAVGNKNFSTYSLVGTIFATWIGSVALLETINQGFVIGISYILIIMGDAINLMFYAIIGKYIHHRFKEAISIGDIIEPVFGIGARVTSGIISSLVCLCYITAQLKAINLFFEYFFAIPHFVSIGLSTFIILAYSTLGGINSVIKTDKLQFIIILIFIVLLVNNVAPKSLNELNHSKMVLHFNKSFFSQYIGIFISFLIPLLLPHMVQRILIAKDSKQCKNAFIISGFLSIIFYLICIILGVFAFSRAPNLHESHVLLFLLENNLGAGFLGLGFIGVMSILISTVDSFMNIASVSLSHDVLKPIFHSKISSKTEVYIAKMCNILMSILAYILSVEFNDVLEIILYALNLWGPIMTVPLYFVIFAIKVPKETFFISLLASSIILIFWEANHYGMDELFAFIPATIGSLIIFTNAWIIKKYNIFAKLAKQNNRQKQNDVKL